MMPAPTIEVDSFVATATPIASVPRSLLHSFSVGVRWPHRLEDWELFLEFGQGYGALDEAGRLIGTAMWFPFGEEFATIGMVIVPPRLQSLGTGQWLMRHLLRDLGSRRIGLNATRAAYRLYLSLGFEHERLVYQCNGIASAHAAATVLASGTLRPVEAGDLAEIAKLDARAFGADRAVLLGRLMGVSTGGNALVRNGRIEAFALSRRFGRGHVVGPIVAAGDEDAVAVTASLVAGRRGQFVRIDTRRPSGLFRDFLDASGLPTFDTVTTMSFGGRWSDGRARCSEGGLLAYGLAAQAIG